MRHWILGAVMALAAGVAAAQGWYEPARGTAERAALMDAARPTAEEALGAPVEFVVSTLRVSGDVAFASLTAQRPGGVPIDLYRTPGYLRGDFYLEVQDPTGIQALYSRHGTVWVADYVVIGATDVWWVELCGSEYHPVISDVCNY